jgi:hypothetical protein
MIFLDSQNVKAITMMKTDTGPACDLKYEKMTGRMVEQKDEVL